VVRRDRGGLWIAGGIAGFFFCAPVAAQVGTPSEVPRINPRQWLVSLSERYWTGSLRADPLRARALGVRDLDDRLPDPTPAALRREQARLRAVLGEAETIPLGRLGNGERISLALLREQVGTALAVEASCRPHLWGLDPEVGFGGQLLQLADFGTTAAGLRALNAYTEGEIANLRSGLATGYSAPKPAVERAIAQLRTLKTIRSAGKPANAPVAAALGRFETYLRREYLPVARSSIAVSALPNGPACYRALLRRATGQDTAVADLHRLGQEELSRAEKEIRSLAPEASPALAAPAGKSAEPVVRRALERARLGLKGAFAVLPRAPLVADVAGAAAWPPAMSEAIAFSAGWPGRRLATALAQEQPELPAFRRQGGPRVFSEGWALYATRLADELGLYSDRTARLGLAVADGLAAGRLLVDTGIHGLNWGRARAVDALADRLPLPRPRLEEEVDRVIACPGCAVAAKLGEVEIRTLREEARRRLGKRFDLGEFHDQVLRNGPVTLAILRVQIEEWIQRRLSAG